MSKLIRSTKPANYAKNPIRAIRRMCLECMGGSPNEVRDCVSASCPLFPFRLGRNPYRAPPTEKQTEARRQNAINHGWGTASTPENRRNAISGT